MKIAFTTSDGTMIDQHFGQCESFQIWEIGPEQASFIESVTTEAHGSDEEDRIAARAKILAECSIVYTMHRWTGSSKTDCLKDSSDENQYRG